MRFQNDNHDSQPGSQNTMSKYERIATPLDGYRKQSFFVNFLSIEGLHASAYVPPVQ